MKKFLLLLCLCIFLIGCSPGNHGIPDTPTQVLYKTVYKTNWLVTLAILGVAFGMFSFLNGSKFGLPLLVSCFVGLTMTLATVRYAEWLALGGLITSVGTTIYSIWRKDIALKEVVKGGEVLKTLDDKVKETFKQIMNNVQSNTTKQIIEKVKEIL